MPLPSLSVPPCAPAPPEPLVVALPPACCAVGWVFAFTLLLALPAVAPPEDVDAKIVEEGGRQNSSNTSASREEERCRYVAEESRDMVAVLVSGFDVVFREEASGLGMAGRSCAEIDGLVIV